MHSRLALAAAVGLLLAAPVRAAAIYEFSFSGPVSQASAGLTGFIGQTISGSFTYEVPAPDTFLEDASTRHFLGGAVEFHLGANTWTGTVSNARLGDWTHHNLRLDTNPNAAFSVASDFAGPSLDGSAVALGVFEIDYDGGAFNLDALPVTTAGWSTFEAAISLTFAGNRSLFSTSFDDGFTYAITLLDDGIPDTPPGGGTTTPISEPGTLAVLALGAVALAAPRRRALLGIAGTCAVLALAAPAANAQASLEAFFISDSGKALYQTYLKEMRQNPGNYAFAISGCGAHAWVRRGSAYDAELHAISNCSKRAIATCRLFDRDGTIVLKGGDLEIIEKEALAARKSAPMPAVDIKALTGPITVVYVGSPSCIWCRQWTSQYEAGWKVSDEAKKVTFHTVMAAKAQETSSPSIWPANLAWLRDQAKAPAGAPWFYLARGDKLVLAQGGISGWHQVHALVKEALATGG